MIEISLNKYAFFSSGYDDFSMDYAYDFLGVKSKDLK